MDDIEKQLPTTLNDQCPPTTIATPTTHIESNNDNTPDIETVESGANIGATSSTMTTPSDSSPGDTTINVILVTVFTILAILMSPFIVAYVIGSICITSRVQDPSTCFSRKKDADFKKLSPKSAKSKEIYMKMLHYETTKEKFQRVNLITITRAGCVVLLWLVVNLCVPALKIVTLFQYPLWKWTLFAVVILLGYPMTMTVAFILLNLVSLFNNEISKQPNLDYILNGLASSLTSLLHCMVVLVLWLYYFRTKHGLHPSKRVDKFGSWTLVSLLVGAILWVLKSATLLKWKADAVHKRFKGRILTAGFQLYFILLVNNDESRLPELLPWREEYKGKMDQKSSFQSSTNIMFEDVAKDRTNHRIQDFMLEALVSVYQIDLVARRVMNFAKVTQRENDRIPQIVAKCHEKFATQNNRDIVQHITEKDLKEKFRLNEEEAQLLLQELKGEQNSDQITYGTFQRWVVDADKNCLSVGYTLIDAFTVVSVLNRVMIGFIFVVVILVWFLLTKLIASTKALVTIAAPFASFSFVFGDTCKTFFQGIIFSFVTHPYDVGDRCIIEGLELEVKRIRILTTTFLKIGTKEKIIYPNATLSTKIITNLEGEPDPSDTIELILDSSTTKSKILGLKEDLKSFFEITNREDYYKKKVHMVVKGIEKGIKVSISFVHVMNIQDVSHSQCLQKKNDQRSELLINIKQFLENQEIKLATL